MSFRVVKKRGSKSDFFYFLFFSKLTKTQSLLVLLGPHPCCWVGDTDCELRGALEQNLPVLGGDAVRDLRTVHLVLHHQHLQLLHVVDEDLLEAGGHGVPGHLVGAVTNVGHLVHSLKTPPHSVINTLRLPPALLDLVIPIRLMTNEFLRPLLDNLRPLGGCESHFRSFKVLYSSSYSL